MSLPCCLRAGDSVLLDQNEEHIGQQHKKRSSEKHQDFPVRFHVRSHGVSRWYEGFWEQWNRYGNLSITVLIAAGTLWKVIVREATRIDFRSLSHFS
jgi:hypothetical protein